MNYGSNGVTSVQSDGVAYTYNYADNGATRTTTVTDPNGNYKVYLGDTSAALLASYTDELGHTTSYTYDANGRVTAITRPEGDSTKLTYDGRGNVTQTIRIAKSGSGLSNIVTSATFLSGCTNVVTCNKPSASFDARGAETDYTYDSTHGGVLTVTSPAAMSGTTRPQSRITYTALNPYYIQYGSGTPASEARSMYQPWLRNVRPDQVVPAPAKKLRLPSATGHRSMALPTICYR